MELFQAHTQWLNRPADERFLSLTALADHTASLRDNSASKVLSSRTLTAQPIAADASHKALVLAGPNGNPVSMTHWSFGQLAQRAGAPAAYLRDLPAPLAADCVNFGLKHLREVEEVGVLLTKKPGDAAYARAVTGPNYGRIWNADIAKALTKAFGDGVSGRYKIPGEFGVKGAQITPQNTTLYAGDRDMWVFLADESNSIEVKNRRGGESGQLSHGFFVWNSEVGKCTFGFAEFLFDYMCGNHIVWGVRDYSEVKLRHTAGANDRYIEQAEPMLVSLATAPVDMKATEIMVAAAQAKKIEDVDAFLKGRFTASQVTAIQAAHVTDESRPIETLWDASTAITAYARSVEHTDARVDLEREAGKVLKLAA